MEGRGVQWDRGRLAWLIAAKRKEDFGYVGWHQPHPAMRRVWSLVLCGLFHCRITLNSGHSWRVVLAGHHCSHWFQQQPQIPITPKILVNPGTLFWAASFENIAHPSVCLSAPDRQDPWVSKRTAAGLLQTIFLTNPLRFSPLTACDATAGQLHSNSLQQICVKRWLLGPWDLRQASGRSGSFVSLPQPGFIHCQGCVCVSVCVCWAPFFPRCFQVMGLTLFSGQWGVLD